MYDEQMVIALKIAFQNAVTLLRKEHDETFYYYAFIFDEGLQPYISAWSLEAYEKSIVENQINEKDQIWWKWDYADSPYVAYGYDECFMEARDILNERASKLSLDELYDCEWEIRISSMEEALKRLDRDGFFGLREKRKEVIINVEVAPPDYHEYERATRLNPQSSLLCAYLETCETEEF